MTQIFNSRDSTRLSQKLNLCLKQINEWFIANKLSLSLDKTCYTVFSKSNVNQLSIQLNGTDIKRVNSCRYLGVIIDCELKWKEHIEYIYKKNLSSIVVYFISYEIYYPVLVWEVSIMPLFIHTYCIPSSRT